MSHGSDRIMDEIFPDRKPLDLTKLREETKQWIEKWNDSQCKNCENYSVGYCNLSCLPVEVDEWCEDFELRQNED